jgi:hypothetical protein
MTDTFRSVVLVATATSFGTLFIDAAYAVELFGLDLGQRYKTTFWRIA